MQSAGIDSRYSRLERFLDKIDEVQKPRDLNEPFRTLWFRIHGIKEDEASKMNYSSPIPSDVEVEPSSGPEGRKRTLEILSPSDVGPTVDMKVEEEKKERMKFKAASGEELETVKQKEKAAQVLVEVRSKMTPLKGMGGEPAKLYNDLKEMAKSYKDEDFQDVIKQGDIIRGRLESEEFRKNILVYLQKKMKEYRETGADTAMAEDKFKDLASCFKNNCDKFIQIAGETNKMAEEAISSIVSDVVSDVEVLDEGKKMSIPLKKKLKTVKRVKTIRKPKVKKKLKPTVEEIEEKEKEEESEKPPKEEETPVEENQEEELEVDASEEEAKPLIKIVKKKITLVPEEDEDDFTIEEDEPEEVGEESEEEISPQPEEGSEEKTETPMEPETTPQTIDETEPQQEIQPESAEGSATEDRDKLTEAYNKIQYVYKVAVKMHEAGKDVTQLFDLINYAEQAREKGDIDTYVGVSKQLETMLISLQK